jgi:hypothetical protein
MGTGIYRGRSWSWRQIFCYFESHALVASGSILLLYSVIDFSATKKSTTALDFDSIMLKKIKSSVVDPEKTYSGVFRIQGSKMQQTAKIYEEKNKTIKKR